MAFVLDQQRLVPASDGRLAEGSRTGGSSAELLPSGLVGRLAGLALTAVVHLGLFALLILNLFGRHDAIPKTAGPNLQVIDLQPFRSQQREQAAPAASASQPTAPQPPTADIVAPEWSRSKLLVASAPPAAAPATIASVSAGQGAGSGSSGGGGDTYDPYAGAAPLRAGAFSQATVAPVVQMPAIDIAARVKEILRIRQPLLHGTLCLRVTLSADGRVTAVRYLGGSLGRSYEPLIVAALLGQRIGTIGGTDGRVVAIRPLRLN